jgi:hypothetical protein
MIPPENEKAPATGCTVGAGDDQVQRDSITLPLRLQRLIGSCPQAGSGVHPWIFKAACKLQHRQTPAESFAIIAAAVSGCGRDVPDREIWDAIEYLGQSKDHRGSRRSGNRRIRQRWPLVDGKQRAKAICKGKVSLEMLRMLSPESLAEQEPQRFLELLFPGNPLICVGQSNCCFYTAKRSQFAADLPKCSLIVPSPMKSVWGVTRPGGLSMHSLDNTGPRKYLITEFDGGTFDEQAAIIWHLKKSAPLAMVVHSGGKSLHAWWSCQGVDESKLRRWMEWAVALGADSRMWTPCQFARMPGGWREDKGKRQDVVYFDGKECVR